MTVVTRETFRYYIFNWMVKLIFLNRIFFHFYSDTTMAETNRTKLYLSIICSYLVVVVCVQIFIIYSMKVEIITMKRQSENLCDTQTTGNCCSLRSESAANNPSSVHVHQLWKRQARSFATCPPGCVRRKRRRLGFTGSRPVTAVNSPNSSDFDRSPGYGYSRENDRMKPSDSEWVSELDHGLHGQREQSEERGRTGEPGRAGPPGLPGRAGEVGIRGSQGLPGYAGMSGASGRPGMPGYPGLAGVPGTPGGVGMRGPPGRVGLPGSPGQAGTPGSSGQAGMAGSPGHAGTPGSSGQAGMPGSPGQAGMPGSPGQAGMPGSPGQAGMSGSSGQAGMPGSPGQAGMRGPQGQAGQPGSPGQAGMPGSPGRSGSRGNVGAPGLQGPPGERGYSGAYGQTGSSGEPGLPGPPGESGYSYTYEQEHNSHFVKSRGDQGNPLEDPAAYEVSTRKPKNDTQIPEVIKELRLLDHPECKDEVDHKALMQDFKTRGKVSFMILVDLDESVYCIVHA